MTFTFQILNVILVVATFSVAKLHPDAHRSFHQIVDRHGYLLEEHTVRTEDGFILKVFRIPGKRSE
jgi:hypothetical protein